MVEIVELAQAVRHQLLILGVIDERLLHAAHQRIQRVDPGHLKLNRAVLVRLDLLR